VCAAGWVASDKHVGGKAGGEEGYNGVRAGFTSVREVCGQEPKGVMHECRGIWEEVGACAAL
jgi:hypothetical protein